MLAQRDDKKKGSCKSWKDLILLNTLIDRFCSSSLSPYHSLETLDVASKEMETIPAYLPNCLQLKDAVVKAKKWLHEAEALQVKWDSCRTFSLRAPWLAI